MIMITILRILIKNYRDSETTSKFNKKKILSSYVSVIEYKSIKG